MAKRTSTTPTTTTPVRRSTRTRDIAAVKAAYKDESSSETELVDGNETEERTPRRKVKTEAASSTKKSSAKVDKMGSRKVGSKVSRVSEEDSPKVKQEEVTQEGVKQEDSPKVKKERTPRKGKREVSSGGEDGGSPPPTKKIKKEKSASDLAAQKLKKLTRLVSSPYPNHPHPTEQECERVTDLLSKLHGPAIRPTGRPIDDTSAGAACGQVPSILDALVRTVLSQNTTSKNSTAAKRNLDGTFGKGNWKAMHEADPSAVEDAIRIGGLAPSKTATIKNVLATALAQYGTFSLDHLHESSNDEAMRELISFKGVGPKTASCVLLFCMARDSFAVDTHVFRLAKSLGWVPKGADREGTYGHLDLAIPARFKYPLHTLLITHGKRCGRCSAHRRAGLLPAAECPLIGLSKTIKEEGERPDDDDENDDEKEEDGKEEEEEEEGEDDAAVVTRASVPEELRATMSKIEDSARQEARDEDGMAVE